MLGSSVKMRAHTHTHTITWGCCVQVWIQPQLPGVWGNSHGCAGPSPYLPSFPNTIEIDITCWDADPVPEEEEGFEGGD